MLRVALRPRFLGLLALMIAATLVCGLLASWQWQRAHRAEHESEPARSAVALHDLMAVGDPVTNELAGRAVTARGTYDPAEQVLVPGRRIDGRAAVIVVTALQVTDRDGAPARLPVARGWIPAADVEGTGGRIDPATIPAAPAGEVTVTGRLEASESAQSAVSADDTVQEIATPMLVNEWGGPMYAGFVAQTSDTGALRPMPAAVSAFSRGLNLQNLGYTVEWIVFGGFFLYLWWRSVRTRYLDEQADRLEAMRQRVEGPRAHTGDTHNPGTSGAPAPEPTPPPVGGSSASTDAKEDGSADNQAPR